LILRPGWASGQAPRTVRANLTEQAAAAFVRRHGDGALAILGERAELAEELGHRVAAKTWREMGGAAVRLLGVEQSDIKRPRPAAPFSVPLPFP
jgi:hypothetical protein